MPIFGARMVCETADIKHIQKVQKETMERETRLGQWADEKALRLKRLRILKQSVSNVKASLEQQLDSNELLDLTQPQETESSETTTQNPAQSPEAEPPQS